VPTISGNTASGKGGGVFVSDSTFTMDGGAISGNKVTGNGRYGGGVSMNYGTFKMNGGTISGNTFTNSLNSFGGGVCVEDSTFNMSGGTIYGLNANPSSLRNTAANGAALYIYDTPDARYGYGSSWTPFDSHEYNDTIRVENGVLQ